VAHRPSTVALADRVAVLEGGRITAVGAHSDLLRDSEHYRHVISSLEAAAREAREPDDMDDLIESQQVADARDALAAEELEVNL
jgi:ATP-binding cassette subfamily B protein